MRPLKDEISERLWDMLSKRLEHLAWKCETCRKLSECEDQPAEGENDSDSRYCMTFLRAAIVGGDEDVSVPFPI